MAAGVWSDLIYYMNLAILGHLPFIKHHFPTPVNSSRPLPNNLKKYLTKLTILAQQDNLF